MAKPYQVKQVRKMAKPYQVKQVRKVLVQHKLGETAE